MTFGAGRLLYNGFYGIAEVKQQNTLTTLVGWLLLSAFIVADIVHR